jgi:hypothetical protein
MVQAKDIFKHPKGSFERLTNKNYGNWAENMRRLLKANDGWDIVNEEEAPVPRPANQTNKWAYKMWKDYRNRYEEAAQSIFNACSDKVRVYLKGEDDPAIMWNKLAEKMDTASTATGRQQIYRTFMATRPIPGAPIGEYFAELTELRNQIAETDEAISDTAFRTHILNTLPAVFEMTAKYQQNQNATVDELLEAILEDERLRMMRTQSDAAAEALASSATTVTKKGRKLHCDFCNTTTHSTDKCWSKSAGKKKGRKNSNGKRDKSSSEDDEDDSDVCFYCAQPGHRSPDCPIKKKAAAARQKKRRTADKDLDDTGSKDAGAGF